MNHRASGLAVLCATVVGVLAVAGAVGLFAVPWDSDSPASRASAFSLEDATFGQPGTLPASHLVGGDDPLVSFQGRLTDPGTGLPVADASYSTTFRVFDAPSGISTEYWSETQSVTTSGGLFSVLLGSVTPLPTSVFTGSGERYLEVQVSPDPAMTPRIRFGTVPYAFAAEQAGAVSRLGFDVSLVDSGTSTGAPAVAIGVDGLPTISYHDVMTTDLKIVHCGNVECSAGNTATTVDSGGDVGEFSSITIGTDGVPIISYYRSDTGDLKVAHCADVTCDSSLKIVTTVDSTGDVGRRSSITIGADGLPIISYHRVDTGDLKVVYCGNIACSSGNIITTLDGPNSGDYSSIAIGGDGLPVISYVGADGLTVALCSNLECTGSLTTTVDSIPVAYTSIAIGADGLPAISYYDDLAKDLKMAHCGNAGCTAGNTLTTVDAAGDVGLATAISIGSDALPVISYVDSSNANLKTVHCGNYTCTVANTIKSAVGGASGGSGFVSSTTIGSDGLPVVAYSSSSTDASVVHCSNVFCLPYHRTR